VDIGGGNGSQLIEILQANPTMRGIIFDLPHVIERAKAPIAAAGLANRIDVAAGSFFDPKMFGCPPIQRGGNEGGVAFFMRHIIHDWEDERSLTILRNCHEALPADGRLLVVESVIPSGNEPFGGKFLDLVMLLIPGGKERTETEYRELFAQAGFTLTKIVPTNSEVSVIEAHKSQLESPSPHSAAESEKGPG
jgi:hypothetical protein